MQAIFAALAEPRRIAILTALRDGERRVTDLIEVTGASQATISEHLQRLAVAGLVLGRRHGRATYYRIGDPAITTLLQLGEAMAVNDEEWRLVPATPPLDLLRAHSCSLQPTNIPPHQRRL